MKKQKLTYPLIYTLMIFLLFLTSCGPEEGNASPTPEVDTANPTEVSPEAFETIAINANIILDPATTEDADSLLVSQYLYEGLVRLDASGTVQPAIAQSWVISDDQLDYIFEIRPNAKFSDGSPITTDVIVDNFNRWFDPQSPFHGSGNYPTWLKTFLAFNGERDAENRAVSLVDGIQKVDQNTVLIHLNRPVPEFLEYAANPAFVILHPDALSASGYGTRESNIISSGAYIILEWADTGITLAPNPNYWNVPVGNIEFTYK